MRFTLIQTLVTCLLTIVGFADEPTPLSSDRMKQPLNITAEQLSEPVDVELTFRKLPLPSLPKGAVIQFAPYRVPRSDLPVYLCVVWDPDSKHFYAGQSANNFVVIGKNIFAITVNIGISIHPSWLEDKVADNISDAWTQLDAYLTSSQAFRIAQLSFPRKLRHAFDSTSAAPSLHLVEASVPDDKHINLSIEAGDGDSKVQSSLTVDIDTMEIVRCTVNDYELTQGELEHK